MRHKRFLRVECADAPPTRAHRPAVWENMLGTVYAMNDAREVRYFDYDHDGALAFAGVREEGRDPRVARATRLHRAEGRLTPAGDSTSAPRVGRLVLWVRERAKVLETSGR